ncbi:MAG: hypothetical protein WCF80_19100 [Pseudolabrys sp.]
MAVRHQKEEVISCALPAALSSIEEGLDLSRVEEVLPSMRISNATLHITRNGKLAHRPAFLRFLSGFNMPLLTKSQYCSVAKVMISG